MPQTFVDPQLVKMKELKINPNIEHSAAYKIFHYFFECHIPAHFLKTESWYKVFTQPYVENEAMQNIQLNEMLKCQLKIYQMAEHFSNGAPIQLVKREDAQRIYEIIMQHLQDWENHCKNFSHFEPKVDDLKKLENLALELYPSAKAQYIHNSKNNEVYSLFSSNVLKRLQKSNILDSSNQLNETVNTKKNTILESIIKNHIGERNG